MNPSQHRIMDKYEELEEKPYSSFDLQNHCWLMVLTYSRLIVKDNVDEPGYPSVLKFCKVDA